MALRTVEVSRYVAPLREGGSMPGLVEGSDDNHYVLKFRGAGQGPLALVAEIVCGRLARALGFRAPEVVLLELDPALGNAEPDPEIQDLIEASGGLNVGLDFLPGALPYTAAAAVEAGWAADVVWFDHLVLNVDRTPRNPNLLCWHGDVWLIDHGAALYRQHATEALVTEAEKPFSTDHVLGVAPDPRLGSEVTRELLEEIVADVPDALLTGPPREAYVDFLLRRTAHLAA